MTPEEKIRSEHPDWSDEQVTAELARQAQPPTPPRPAADEEKDRAFADLRRRADAAEADAKAARDALAAKERAEAEQQGQWKELAEREQARADQLAADIEKGRQDRGVEQIAKRLKFRNTDDALLLLPATVDRSDETAVTAALEALATERKYLVDTGPAPPSGGPAGGSDGDPPALTRAQIAAMSARQVAALSPEVVAKAMSTP